MLQTYNNFVADNLTLYFVSINTHNTNPAQDIVNWCNQLSLYHTTRLSLEECENSFTVCECTVTLERETLHHIRDSTNGTPTLRTQMLLYTIIDAKIYAVGVMDTYSYLILEGDDQILIPFDQVTDVRWFLNDLAKQKYKIEY